MIRMVSRAVLLFTVALVCAGSAGKGRAAVTMYDAFGQWVMEPYSLTPTSGGVSSGTLVIGKDYAFLAFVKSRSDMGQFLKYQ